MRLKFVFPILLLGICVAVAVAQPQPPRPQDEILDVLRAAEAAWNAGDIPGYMACYHEADDLRFVGGDTVTYGWQRTLDRYRAHYPDRAAMGRLAFSDLDVRLLGPESALVFGRWRLERAGDAPQGVFTLVWRRFPEGWRVVHDHTSGG